MDKSKLIQRLMATFLEELEEHVGSFNRNLLALEKDPEHHAESLKSLFRTAHSLKGAARAVNVVLIEKACHQLEEILGGLRDGQVPRQPEIFALLFAAADGLEEAGMRLREQQDLTDAPLALLLPRLEAAAPVSPKTHAQKEPRPAKTPSGQPTAPAKKQEPASLPAAGTGEGQPETSPGSGSLRVSAEKLDLLLARIGELLIARRRVETRLQDLSSIQEFVDQWQNQWQRVEKTVAQLLPEQVGAGPAAPARLARPANLMVRQTGDHLRRLNKDLQRLAKGMRGDNRLLEQTALPLDEEVRRVRMLPFDQACAGLERMVRDLAQAGGKEATLAIEGADVELDRSILEGLKDPLRHLVRNAVDHGLETPQERQQAGKPVSGRITVSASLRGSQVEVVVQDDGKGLNLDAIRQQARRHHLAEPANEHDLAHLIFLPGFSTAAIISDVSGRGVGMDVVKSQVEALHGTVDLSFAPSAGTRFTLTVPLTLTTLRAVLVRVGAETYAFAGTNVHKLVRVDLDNLRSMAGRDMVTLGGTPLPFAFLGDVLQPLAPRAAGPNNKVPALIVSAGERQMVLAVDEFLTEQEVVIKSLGARIRHAPLVAGATLLPSGRIALVLNAANLIRAALLKVPQAWPQAGETAAPQSTRKRLLVVEDSVTTRTLEKSILEAVGYEVATAVDGQAAWHYLQEHEPDLIVSDVDMPNMDGFALTEAVRASPKLRATPVILVTARGTDEDKARGIQVGADAYLVKSSFDQRNLLETIAQLL